jgi:DNA-binding IscR family transcriptional regulator
MLILLGREAADAAGGWTAERFAAQLDIPAGALQRVIDCLAEAGILRIDEQGCATLATVPQGIAVADIIEALRRTPSARLSLAVRAEPASRDVLARLDAGVRASLVGLSLSDLLGLDQEPV